MAFERITIAVGKTKAPAGICITKHGKTIVSVRGDLVSGLKVQDTFAVLLGNEDDAGKLRIVKDEDGVACARQFKRTSAFFFNLGMVPAIGTVKCKQQQTTARTIKDGIEIDIPALGPKLLAAPVAARSTVDTASDATSPSSPAQREERGGAPKTKVTGETFGDVVINTAEDQERIAFKGKSLAVSAREATFLTILAKPRPNAVGLPFIISKIWGDRPPSSAQVMVIALVTDLKKSLPSIGLTVNHVKGVGYQLKDNV